MNKIKLAVIGFGTTAVGLLGSVVAHAQMTTTTLGTSIDSTNTTTYDYFTVLLAKYWPFVVGFAILLGVWHFGRRIIQSFL